MGNEKRDVVIIDAGLIGLMTAYELAKRGAQVTVQVCVLYDYEIGLTPYENKLRMVGFLELSGANTRLRACRVNNDRSIKREQQTVRSMSVLKPDMLWSE